MLIEIVKLCLMELTGKLLMNLVEFCFYSIWYESYSVALLCQIISVYTQVK